MNNSLGMDIQGSELSKVRVFEAQEEEQLKYFRVDPESPDLHRVSIKLSRILKYEELLFKTPPFVM